jgi:hypothetical protein
MTAGCPATKKSDPGPIVRWAGAASACDSRRVQQRGPLSRDIILEHSYTDSDKVTASQEGLHL